MAQVSYPCDNLPCHDKCMKLEDFTMITGGKEKDRKTIPYKSAYNTGNLNFTNDTTLTTVKYDMIKTIQIHFALFGHHTKIDCSKFKLKIITTVYNTGSQSPFLYISLAVE